MRAGVPGGGVRRKLPCVLCVKGSLCACALMQVLVHPHVSAATMAKRLFPTPPTTGAAQHLRGHQGGGGGQFLGGTLYIPYRYGRRHLTQSHLYIERPTGETSSNHLTHPCTHANQQVKVQADYPVTTSGVQNVLFQLCPTLVSAREIELQGEIGFENPYGCVRA